MGNALPRNPATSSPLPLTVLSIANIARSLLQALPLPRRAPYLRCAPFASAAFAFRSAGESFQNEWAEAAARLCQPLLSRDGQVRSGAGEPGGKPVTRNCSTATAALGVLLLTKVALCLQAPGGRTGGSGGGENRRARYSPGSGSRCFPSRAAKGRRDSSGALVIAEHVSFTGKTARMLHEVRAVPRPVIVDPKCAQLAT